MLQLNVARGIVVGIPWSGGHEVCAGNHGFHSRETGPLLGVKKRAQDGLVTGGIKAIETDHARFQKRSSKSDHGLVSDLLVDAEGRSLGASRWSEVQRGLRS